MEQCDVKITNASVAHKAYCLPENGMKICGTFGSNKYRYTKVEIITRGDHSHTGAGVNTYFATSLDQQSRVTQTQWNNMYHNVNPGRWHQKIESYFSRVKYRYQNVWAGILPLGTSTVSEWHEVTRYKREYTRLVPWDNSTGECLTFYLRSSRESIDDTYTTTTFMDTFADVGGYLTALGIALTLCLVVCLMLLACTRKVVRWVTVSIGCGTVLAKSSKEVRLESPARPLTVVVHPSVPPKVLAAVVVVVPVAANGAAKEETLTEV